jgi:hypothetical protein
MKPNIAAPLAIVGTLLVFLITPSRARLLLLTFTAFGCAVGVLKLTEVDVWAMIASYRTAAQHRGILTAIGFSPVHVRRADVLRVFICAVALIAPLWVLRRGLTDALRTVDVRLIAWYLLLGLGPAIGIFGMFSNVDLKDIEWPMLICAGAVILFGTSPPNGPSSSRLPSLVRFYVAFLCSLAAADLYITAVRYRVEGIGIHRFFEWNDSSHVPGNQFFPNLKASARFETTVTQVGQVLRQYPGPVFFGPRMEFGYAAFNLPSPKHLPILWDPGNQFSSDQESTILADWQHHKFATLIFLKDDFTYYSREFFKVIDLGYSRDDTYSQLTVFHAKVGIIGTVPLRTSGGIPNE